MKNKINLIKIGSLILLLAISEFKSYAQEVYHRKGYELTIINNAKDLDGDVKNSLVETFFTVYPLLARNYNLNTVKR